MYDCVTGVQIPDNYGCIMADEMVKSFFDSEFCSSLIRFKIYQKSFKFMSNQRKLNIFFTILQFLNTESGIKELLLFGLKADLLLVFVQGTK